MSKMDSKYILVLGIFPGKTYDVIELVVSKK